MTCSIGTAPLNLTAGGKLAAGHRGESHHDSVPPINLSCGVTLNNGIVMEIIRISLLTCGKLNVGRSICPGIPAGKTRGRLTLAPTLIPLRHTNRTVGTHLSVLIGDTIADAQRNGTVSIIGKIYHDTIR